METQETTRPERATLTLTREEKQAVKAVAALRGLTEDSLLRSTLIADVVAAYERAREYAA